MSVRQISVRNIKALIFCLTTLLINGCSLSVKPNTDKNNTATTSNQINSRCFAPKKNFIPITTIKSRTSYLDKAHDFQPITSSKGFIAWDFSKDGFLDYIFIEKQQKHAFKKSKGIAPVIRLVICKSQKNVLSKLQYKRVIPKFTLYESHLPDFQAESHSIKKVADELLISRSYHEHNWGSDYTLNSYRFNNRVNDFVLTGQKISSSSGDGYRSDLAETYDFVTGSYSKKRKCGEFVGPCKDLNTTGEFKVKQVLLEKSDKLFRRNIKIQ